MWSWRHTSAVTIRRFLAGQEELAWTYPEVGASNLPAPPGYDFDHQRAALGRGGAIFEAACAAIRQWRMFPPEWMAIHPPAPPVRPGQTVAVLARAFGGWWLNSCRIVYVLDEEEPFRRFGFGYGTLPGHVECGEECFRVEWLPDGTVWYDVRAFSHPRHWLARLGYPVVRRLQRRFARDSLAAMRRAVAAPMAPERRGPESIPHGA